MKLFNEAIIKGLGNLLGLADAAALNHDVVKLAELRDAEKLLEKVAAEVAADASILQSNDLVTSLGEGMSLLDQGCIDVDPG